MKNKVDKISYHSKIINPLKTLIYIYINLFFAIIFVYFILLLHIF